MCIRDRDYEAQWERFPDSVTAAEFDIMGKRGLEGSRKRRKRQEDRTGETDIKTDRVPEEALGSEDAENESDELDKNNQSSEDI